MTEKTSCPSGYAALMKNLRQMEKNGLLYRMFPDDTGQHDPLWDGLWRL